MLDFSGFSLQILQL